MKQKLFLLITIAFFIASCNNSDKSTTQNKTDMDTLNEFVPQWAKSVIWYQIFPERFCDGDSTNNPTVNDIIGADPQELPKKWNIHPWGSDWYKLQDYEIANGEPELWKHLLRRRYGGDLQGIINKLDYLQELGISGIYLNPVFIAPSLHKYDGASYHHIDPNFGPDPEGDRKLIATENPLDTATWVWTKADELALKLIAEAHKRGIKIIFDGVFNHMGINSFAFQDVVKNQEKSLYKDWFIIKSFENKAKSQKFEYEGWWGVKSLPELKEDSLGIVAGPKEYIFNATRRWMNPKGMGTEFGIDGWRLDVAFCVSHLFWKDWRVLVKSINPQAYLTAEIVNTPEVVKPYLQGDEFDAEMNYNFAFTCTEFFFNPDSTKTTATEFDAELKRMREMYPQGVAYVLQNLFGSHDSNRIGSLIVNRGIGSFRDWGTFFGLSQAANNKNYNVRKPNAEEITLQKMFIVMQMTYIGAPMIYYGDEVGMWGANDPDCRKPMIWEDITYEDETYNPDQSKRNPDKVEINYDLLDFYKKMIAIRNSLPALQLGETKTLITDDKNDIYAFMRSYQNQNVIVVFNNSTSNQTVSITLEDKSDYSELLKQNTFEQKGKNITLNMLPKSAAVLRNNE